MGFVRPGLLLLALFATLPATTVASLGFVGLLLLVDFKRSVAGPRWSL
jgi:hypothetical protein